jgi:hypothetical protein
VTQGDPVTAGRGDPRPAVFGGAEEPRGLAGALRLVGVDRHGDQRDVDVRIGARHRHASADGSAAVVR